jgi:hypothetical protein
VQAPVTGSKEAPAGQVKVVGEGTAFRRPFQQGFTLKAQRRRVYCGNSDQGGCVHCIRSDSERQQCCRDGRDGCREGHGEVGCVSIFFLKTDII